MGNFFTLTLKKWVLPGGVATALALTLAGAPEKWEAHTRWRELFRSAPETERWFMPGDLGHEPGAAPGRLSDRAFLTRAMSGVGRFDDNQWAKQNRLTPRLDFSHNLVRVFPPDLYAEHPEFFPEEQGVRIHPPAGTGWWQPDLGREDVAAYAAGGGMSQNRFPGLSPSSISSA